MTLAMARCRARFPFPISRRQQFTKFFVGKKLAGGSVNLAVLPEDMLPHILDVAMRHPGKLDAIAGRAGVQAIQYGNAPFETRVLPFHGGDGLAHGTIAPPDQRGEKDCLLFCVMAMVGEVAQEFDCPALESFRNGLARVEHAGNPIEQIEAGMNGVMFAEQDIENVIGSRCRNDCFFHGTDYNGRLGARGNRGDSMAIHNKTLQPTST